jgi:hypothetical protein
MITHSTGSGSDMQLSSGVQLTVKIPKVNVEVIITSPVACSTESILFFLTNLS